MINGKINFEIDGFNYFQLPIDVFSISYYSGTEGYTNGRQRNSISFRVSDEQELEETLDIMYQYYKLNEEYAPFNKSVTTRTEFESYESDKRPKITIYYDQGMKGICNPSSFDISELT